MFKDRVEAGRELGKKLKGIVKGKGMVLGIPRGGVVVANEVAKALNWPLGVCVTKKIGAPGQEELAVGAMGPRGEIVWDESLLKALGIKKDDLKKQIQKTRNKIQTLRKVLPGVLPGSDPGKRTVVLVDDGVATGRTVEAAIAWLRQECKIILAVPVCAKDTRKRLEKMVDKFVCLETPEDFRAVGQFYEKFDEVSDRQVEKLLVVE